MKISKTISRGGEITSLDYLLTLARAKRAVVVQHGNWYWIRPAAFIVNWPLTTILRYKFYHAVKEKNAPEDNQ